MEKWQDELNFKICDVTTSLTNTSRSIDNQAGKFGQLIEYNIKKIFLRKLYTKCCVETISRPFSKRLKLSIFLDQSRKVL